MPTMTEFHKSRIRDSFCHVTGSFNRCKPVVFSLEYQRRHIDSWKDCPVIALDVGLQSLQKDSERSFQIDVQKPVVNGLTWVMQHLIGKVPERLCEIILQGFQLSCVPAGGRRPLFRLEHRGGTNENDTFHEWPETIFLCILLDNYGPS